MNISNMTLDPESEHQNQRVIYRMKLLQRACELYFLQTPHPSQRAMLSAAHFLDPFQFITPSPTCIILPATHSLVVSGGKFIG